MLRFTIIMGTVSSVFDIVTFARTAQGFGVDAALFQKAWFVKWIATQILVIFVIRSRRLPWRRQPATPNPCHNVDRRCHCRCCPRPRALALAVRFQRATDVAAGDDWRDHPGVSLDGRKRQTRGADRQDDGVSEAGTVKE